MDNNSGNRAESNSSRPMSFAELRAQQKIEPTAKQQAPAKPVEQPKPDKNRFKALRDAGYQPLPVVPPGAPLSERSSLFLRMKRGQGDGRGKAPGVQGADGLWHGLGDWVRHQPTDEDLERYHASGASIGVRAGPQ